MCSCVVGVRPVQLVPGQYSGTCIAYELAQSFRGSTKFKLAFAVDAEHEKEPVIEAYFNVKKLIDRERDLFEIGFHSDLYRNTVRLAKAPKTVAKFTSDDFIQFYLNKKFILRVEHVTKDSNNRELHREAWYSKVAFIEAFKETEGS